MKKKYMFGLLGLFAIAMVSALVLPYLAQVQTDVTVDASYVFVGENSSIASGVFGGQTISSDNLSINSQTSVNIPLDISTGVNPSDEGISHTEEYILSTVGIEGHDSGIYITAEDAGVETLDDLINMSWNVNVLSGYIAHVDVLIDTTGDGVADDALVFEYDKVDDGCGDGVPFPLGEMNTFGDKGIISDSSYAWLSSGSPGNCQGDIDYTVKTLAEWKALDYTVIGFDVEIDNWIVESKSNVKNILINGNEVELTLKPSQSLDFRVLTEFGLLNIGDYTITTTVDVR